MGDQTLPPLYRPPKPNAHWAAGAIARRTGAVPRDWCPYSLAGNRWEWEAGWDYEDREIEAGR